MTKLWHYLVYGAIVFPLISYCIHNLFDFDNNATISIIKSSIIGLFVGMAMYAAKEYKNKEDS